jgi:predicted transcriptional regulator
MTQIIGKRDGNSNPMVVRFNDTAKDAIEALARFDGCSQSELVRTAVREYVKRRGYKLAKNTEGTLP